MGCWGGGGGGGVEEYSLDVDFDRMTLNSNQVLI